MKIIPKLPDFWYVLGYNYEVTVFKTLEQAKQRFTELMVDSPDDYYHIFEGYYGGEFSGWIGANEDQLVEPSD